MLRNRRGGGSGAILTQPLKLRKDRQMSFYTANNTAVCSLDYRLHTQERRTLKTIKSTRR